ncbi:MATE family efflux transporter [Gorillibacterium massiliense]|uniref:MATE family efflux transporter n=1 Tax=Gorillibacterium massiliense TaxID=1280390 RepID=UPI0004BCD164|nr:MATE family efflux transporter [Gorillibacterium massiliense]
MTKNWKMILALALPSLLAFATSTLTGTINLIMVGKMGTIAIGAVGAVNIIMYNAWALCSGLGHTINYLVAQGYGAKDMKKAVERTTLALYICVLVALVTISLGLFAPKLLMGIISDSSAVIDAGVPYLRIRFFALAFGATTFVMQGFLRGTGDTKTPMYFSLIGNLLMIFFTYTLTYGNLGFPELGLPGAAWGVLIGEAFSFFGCAYMYFVKRHKTFTTRILVPVNPAEARLIAVESGKLGIQEFAMSLAMFIFTMFVARISDTALAANEVALSVMSLGFMPAFAFGATATILVGQEVGRNNPEKARRYGTDTAILGTFFLLALGIVEFIFPEQIARIYIDQPEVYKLAADLLRISAFLQLFDGLFNFYGGCLRGLGDTGFLVKASFGLSWIVFIPLAYLLTFVLHMDSIGSWIGLYTFITLYGIVVLIRFYRTEWGKLAVK